MNATLENQHPTYCFKDFTFWNKLKIIWYVLIGKKFSSGPATIIVPIGPEIIEAVIKRIEYGDQIP